jgi:exopolyphosphatase / guanosine-5'-triphosphate,3'-diphosphate pyrophosphatase
VRPGVTAGPLFAWGHAFEALNLSAMESIRRAVIDVGTNSVKLLVADVGAREVLPVWEGSKQTRLGKSFYETHRLQPEPMLRTAEAVAEFAAQARALKATSVRIIATSAARDAINAAELSSAIRQACSLETLIISGDQEADWAFRGVATDPALREAALLLLDVGGGSTEFILGQGEERHFCESFPMGTVRLLEKLPHSDPPTMGQLALYRGWLNDFLNAQVRPKLQPALAREKLRLDRAQEIQLIGTGGTVGILGSMEAELKTFDRGRLEMTRLSRERLRWHVEHLWRLPLTERKKITGLPPNRADVILAGAAIYEAVMELFDFQELRISTRGLRFAAVREGTWS